MVQTYFAEINETYSKQANDYPGSRKKPIKHRTWTSKMIEMASNHD